MATSEDTKMAIDSSSANALELRVSRDFRSPAGRPTSN